MAKTRISEFDIDPANNTDINSINIAEGCAPSGINNAIRQLMSDLKEFQTGAGGDSFVVGGAFSANGGATLGDASGDALTINSSAVSIPNGLNFDSNTFVIDATNNRVGVGTASPASSLDVYGSSVAILNSYNNGQLTVGTNTGTSASTLIQAPNYISFTTYNGSFLERMRIDYSGNVGIGTSSPTFASGSSGLHINSATGTNARLKLSNGNTGAGAFDGFDLSLGTDGAINLVGWEASPMNFFTNGTERMRIDSSGNLLVNVTSWAQTYDSSNPNNGSKAIGVVSTDDAGLYLKRTSSNGAIAYFSKGGVGVVGSISVTASATAYNTSSDYRLKENIAPMTGALATVSALKPVTYTWKADGSDGQGFIAHELQAVVPECVTGEKDAIDADGNPVYQGIDTSFLVATLTAAIQELKAQLDESNLILTSVKTELDTVKAEVTALKGTA